MKKKIAVIFLALVCALPSVLSGCKGGGAGRVKVVATIFPCYDFARAAAGGGDGITMLIDPGAEVHTYEPSVRDVETIRNCQLFIYIGGESDVWVETVLSPADTSGMRILRLMDCVEAVEEEVVEGMQEEEEEEAEEEGEEPEYDEHIWTSPANAVRMVNAVRDALIELDGGNAAEYAENAAAYVEKITGVQRDLRRAVDSAVRKKIVVADRFPFRYLADEFGLEYAAAFPGCSAESDISAATLAYLVNVVRSENIPCVYYLEMGGVNIANTVRNEVQRDKTKRVATALLHSCERVTAAEFRSGATYVSLMKNNVTALKKGVA
jgi:zinc transport system substrate-binding protein